jgi:DNA polymerase-3 subunit delta
MAKRSSLDIYNQLRSELTSGQPKPVYFLFGDEEFFLDQLSELIHGLIPYEQKDFNFDQLYGQDISPARALGIARSFPMMADKRILLIRNFLQISKGAGDAQSGHINDFLAYFDQPNPTTLLVLIDTNKPPGNTTFGKKIARHQNVGFYEFAQLPDYLLPDWVIDWTKSKYSKQIDAASAQLLAQFVGNSLQLLSVEIDKVCTYVDTSDRITSEDVKKIIGAYREFSAIELKEALMKRDQQLSLRIAEQILQHTKGDTGELIRTVGFFYSVFLNIWQIRRLMEKGMPKQQIQSDLGVKSAWYFNKLWQDAAHYQLAEMPRIFEALLDADRSLKGFSTLDPTSILFLLVKRILG